MNPMGLLDFVEFSLVGIALGGLYALIAVGFVLIYKATRVLNFAMGEFMMIGAYLFWTATVPLGLPWTAGLAFALAGSAATALVVERGVLRPLVGQPTIAIVMATIGLASIMHGAAQIVWGPDQLGMPSFLPRQPVFFGEAMLTGQLFWAFVLSIAIFAAFILFFRFSRTGVAMRATAADPQTAMSLGIDVRRSYALTWVFAALTGAVSGIVVGAMTNVSPNLGAVGLGVIAVVILGGLDSLTGAIVAGVAIGWIESMTVALFGGQVRDIVPYCIILAIMVLRPYGLFGTPDIERL
jgi:branched-chain amino acid transport system permease protein